MNLILLLFFGIFMVSVFNIYRNPVLLNGHNHCGYESNRIIIFPLLLLVFCIFVSISSFQYIDISPSAKWINMNNNDMSRYKMGFDSMGRMSIREAFVSQAQEPLYVLSVFLLRKISPYFSFALVVFYSFIFLCLTAYLKFFLYEKSFSFYFLFFTFLYTAVITSYCLLRMGLAIAWILLAYRYLFENDYKRALLFSVIACGFHFSAIFAFSVIIVFRFSERHSFRQVILFSTLLFAICFLFSKIVQHIIISIFPSKSVYIGGDGGVAKNTYISNFLFVLLMALNKKSFYKDRKSRLAFCILLCSFYIFPLQIVAVIFYRMIFFTYPGIFYIAYLVYKNYGGKKHMFLNVSVRSFVIFYSLFFLYKFCTTTWLGYGLDRFSLFYIN